MRRLEFMRKMGTNDFATIMVRLPCRNGEFPRVPPGRDVGAWLCQPERNGDFFKNRGGHEKETDPQLPMRPAEHDDKRADR